MGKVERYRIVQTVVGIFGAIAAIWLFFAADGEAAGRISAPEVLRALGLFGGPFLLFFFVRRTPYYAAALLVFLLVASGTMSQGDESGFEGLFVFLIPVCGFPIVLVSMAYNYLTERNPPKAGATIPRPDNERPWMH